MNIFGHEDIRTKEEKARDEELEELLYQYKNKFSEQLNTENLQISDEQLIKDVKHCLKEGITLDVIYPGINDYDEDDDL